MAYVQTSGLGLAPVSSFLKPVVKKVVKPAPTVKTAPIARPAQPLLNFRPVPLRGQQVVTEPAQRPMIPALRAFTRIANDPAQQARAREQVNRALPGRMRGALIGPVVNVTRPKPVFTWGGTEYKNTQVQVQVGADKNSSTVPDLYTQRGDVLTIKEPTPTDTIGVTVSPEVATRQEAVNSAGSASAPWLQIDPVKVNLPESKDTGSGIISAGFSPVVWIALGLLALGMFTGKKKRG